MIFHRYLLYLSCFLLFKNKDIKSVLLSYVVIIKLDSNNIDIVEFVYSFDLFVEAMDVFS